MGGSPDRELSPPIKGGYAQANASRRPAATSIMRTCVSDHTASTGGGVAKNGNTAATPQVPTASTETPKLPRLGISAEKVHCDWRTAAELHFELRLMDWPRDAAKAASEDFPAAHRYGMSTRPFIHESGAPVFTTRSRLDSTTARVR